MFAPNNIISPSSGEPIAVPSQRYGYGDVSIWLKIEMEKKGEGKILLKSWSSYNSIPNDKVGTHAKTKG